MTTSPGGKFSECGCVSKGFGRMRLQFLNRDEDEVVGLKVDLLKEEEEESSQPICDTLCKSPDAYSDFYMKSEVKYWESMWKGVVE